MRVNAPAASWVASMFLSRRMAFEDNVAPSFDELKSEFNRLTRDARYYVNELHFLSAAVSDPPQYIRTGKDDKRRKQADTPKQITNKLTERENGKTKSKSVGPPLRRCGRHLKQRAKGTAPLHVNRVKRSTKHPPGSRSSLWHKQHSQVLPTSRSGTWLPGCKVSHSTETR